MAIEMNEHVEKLLYAIGISLIDYDRFLQSGNVDFDRVSPGSQLGRYIAKVKRESDTSYWNR
jgi:hypothetical protein